MNTENKLTDFKEKWNELKELIIEKTHFANHKDSGTRHERYTVFADDLSIKYYPKHKVGKHISIKRKELTFDKGDYVPYWFVVADFIEEDDEIYENEVNEALEKLRNK